MSAPARLIVAGTSERPSISVRTRTSSIERFLQQGVVDVALQARFVDAKAGRRVALRIGIDHEHALAEHRERRAQIHRGRALADAAFLIDECDDARQNVLPALRNCDAVSALEILLERRSSAVRSLRSGASVTCSKSQRSAAPTRRVAGESRAAPRPRRPSQRSRRRRRRRDRRSRMPVCARFRRGRGEAKRSL